jgi:ATP-dependent Lhr-like helicase
MFSSAAGPLDAFHPVVAGWFRERLGEPTPPQVEGWPRVCAGEDVLIAAPTGSGKTLSAFLAAIDGLFRRGLEGTLGDHTHVVYVSPLKALGNDVRKNLLEPLAEIHARARAAGLSPQEIRVQVRTGDTSASERARMVRRPPHILITTPESFYLYITAARSRETVRRVETVIVDEIHALARDKRGSHFSLSLARLNEHCETRPQLVGLSATVRPVDRIAAFLTGSLPATCRTVEVGHRRPWDIRIETPDEELTAVASHESWGHVYDRLVELSAQHRTMLVFANTRRLAERVAHDLGERVGEGKVAAHHGSMARELRLAAEDRLKRGELRVMVATASLELGIDVGSVDLVVQLGSPRAIATALQRIGRAGHHKAGIAKGIVFALTRDELVECAALLRSIHAGLLDAVHIPEKPLDVLAQQLVAACVVKDWGEDELFALCRRAYPYRDLTRAEFDGVVAMLAEGASTAHRRARTHLHHDRVHRVLRARRGARITALTDGGAIPDTFSYAVVAEPEAKQVGTLDEDFAVEAMAGDVFLLGSTSWRIQSVRGSTVRVENAHGQAPTVPFWRGEAPSRTGELSHEVGRLREDVLAHEDPLGWLERELRLSSLAADQLVRYLRAGQVALGSLPSTHTIVAERFFDEAGGMQLVLHAPLGGRINRAWGLALRKRFCRTFDFELQAAATDDGVLLSLGEQHSFPLADVFSFLDAGTVEAVLVQAVLQAPLFGTRFRWNASRALALARFQNGKRVPAPIQRARSDDLMAAVFPAQVACQDNHGVGDIEIPDHPLVTETLRDCLREAMDVDGLARVLRGIASGAIRTIAVDVPEPSPLSHAILNSNPYTYLDDAPLEERRARAVSVRRTLSPEDAAAFGALDADAIAQVVADAQPIVRDAEDLHHALLQLVIVRAGTFDEASFAALAAERRATELVHGDARLWVAAERVGVLQGLFPTARLSPRLEPLADDGPWTEQDAALAVVLGRMEVCGPVLPAELAATVHLPVAAVEAALAQLESRGSVLRGRFRPGAEAAEAEWCDRRLLQRIHRQTVGRLRREIEPLSGRDFMRFLFRWHHVGQDGLRGRAGLLRAIALLEGYEAPAAAWETMLLPARMNVGRMLPDLLERASYAGEIAWGRLSPRTAPKSAPGPRRGAVAEVEVAPTKRSRATFGRAASLTFVRRESLDWMLSAMRGPTPPNAPLELPADLSHPARDVALALERRGASFFPELVSSTGRLAAEVEDALWELLARGIVTADVVDNLRVLLSPARKRTHKLLRRGGPGRWTLLRSVEPQDPHTLTEKVANVLLGRYGVVFRELVVREPLAPTWRELLSVLRRMEARGEVRGGRFLAGLAGEQFALPGAVDLARSVRRQPPSGHRVRLAAVDPLNLTGVVTPGARIPATLGSFVDYVDGVPVDPGGDTETERPVGSASPLPVRETGFERVSAADPRRC